MVPLITPLLAFPFVLYLTPSSFLRFLSLTGIIFLTGWSWLQREGSRIEQEAENLRQLRSAITDEDDGNASAGSAKGGKIRRVRSWRDLIEEEEEKREREDSSAEESAE